MQLYMNCPWCGEHIHIANERDNGTCELYRYCCCCSLPLFTDSDNQLHDPIQKGKKIEAILDKLAKEIGSM